MSQSQSHEPDDSPSPSNNPIPPLHDKPPRSPAGESAAHQHPSRPDDGSDRRQHNPPSSSMSNTNSDPRASGELEGSTLGSSSRDGGGGGVGEGGTSGGHSSSRAQRSTHRHSSSAFLVDSSFLPRSKSLRNSFHRPRRSEPDSKEKRSVPEPEIAVAKKRSRFPWSRHKGAQAQRESAPASGAGLDGDGHIQTTPDASRERPTEERDAKSSHSEPREAVAAETETEGRDSVGLDRDSLQIVNLALNLSESRKRQSVGAGRSASARLSGSGWPAPDPSSSSPVASYRDASSPATGPYTARARNVTLANAGESSKAASSENERSSVWNLLPQSVDPDSIPQGFSMSTLARAERARRHFELSAEYLRLLSSLPPLNPNDPHANSDSGTKCRAYDPLQSIRNRKVRFRERCAIDPEAQGWDDLHKVHTWVNEVQAQHGHQRHGSFECLRLPPFQRNPMVRVHEEPEEEDMGASPPSSLRRASRASSVVARRPRFDWLISPAELLADAAWVEEDRNKSKIIDRDGANLYPDPTLLIASDEDDAAKHETKQPPKRVSVDTDHPASRTSLSDTYSGLTTEFKSVGRGRHRDRIPSPPGTAQSSSISPNGRDPKRYKLHIRSHSSSSASSVYGRGLRSSTDYPRSPTGAGSPYLGATKSRGLGPPLEEETSLDLKHMSTQDSERSGKTPGRSRLDKRESMSSIPSIDDRYDPLTSLAGTKADPLGGRPGYFPGIASNLSPPSSRSPSPSKRRLPRAIVSRRERSRSNPRNKEVADESDLDSEAARKNSSQVAPTESRQSKLEPSPLPDRVASASTPQKDQHRQSIHGRKGSKDQESKLRGIFKGPGKIAGKVGNEVSKMGDFIMKKDGPMHSRKSSTNSSSSDDSSSSDEEDEKGDKVSGPMSFFRRRPAAGDDRPSRRSLDKFARANVSSPPHGDDEDEERKVADYGSPRRHATDSQLYDSGHLQRKDNDNTINSPQKKTDIQRPFAPPAKALTFGPEMHKHTMQQIQRGQIKDPSVPFSMTRPPVTGLAQVKASPGPSSGPVRPSLSVQSRSWSISERSISSSKQTGIPGKREVARTRALLLSSGIKAREITRRAESVRNPPPEFLRRPFRDHVSAMPAVARLHEHDLAAHKLLESLDASHTGFSRCLSRWESGATSAPLRSQLRSLEDKVHGSLTPRIQHMTDEAESLSVALNTTSTLAVKALRDRLEQGVRKRHRRLRLVRRAGFVMLEWALVGMLWWVWLLVMAFKVVRGVVRGVGRGLRWVVWL